MGEEITEEEYQKILKDRNKPEERMEIEKPTSRVVTVKPKEEIPDEKPDEDEFECGNQDCDYASNVEFDECPKCNQKMKWD